MPLVASFGSVGLGGLLVIASPPGDPDPGASRPDPAPSTASEGGRFQPEPNDPRASDYEPPERIYLTDFTFPLRVSNHVIRVFGLERPHAYGLDLQLGVSLLFEGERERAAMLVRPETGYAFVHHAELDSHASITGLGVCLVTYAGVSLCHTPSFVVGAEEGVRSLGLRQALGLELAYVGIEVQHGVAWVGSAGARHELRGTLSVDVLSAIWILATVISISRI